MAVKLKISNFEFQTPQLSQWKQTVLLIARPKLNLTGIPVSVYVYVSMLVFVVHGFIFCLYYVGMLLCWNDVIQPGSDDAVEEGVHHKHHKATRYWQPGNLD